MVAIRRACDAAGLVDQDEREAFAQRYYRGDASPFERAAVAGELAEVTRADIGRPAFTDTTPCGLDLRTEGPIANDGFEGDPFDQI